MDQIINLGIPHVGEHIFQSIATVKLLEFLSVSQAWKVLAENVLFQRWKDSLRQVSIVGMRLEMTDIVDVLLRNPGTQSKGGTVFYWACSTRQVDIVKILLNRSAANKKSITLNARDVLGQTAFMKACQNGHMDIVQSLINHCYVYWNIKINAVDNLGNTAINLARRNGKQDIVKLLIEHPAIDSDPVPLVISLVRVLGKKETKPTIWSSTSSQLNQALLTKPT